MKAIKKSFTYGRHTVTLETGEIARQADGAVMVSMDDTVVLVTCVARTEVKQGQDFFPLTVDYQEKTFAAGKIPGGFFKREGRPSEKEILTCRLIDRPLRPLFPDGFYNEVQIIATVLSCDPEIDPDIPAMIGASAAVTLAGVPFEGPIGAARVGYIDGQYVLNPTKTELATSKLDLVVAGTETAVLMVESEAHELSEEVMLGAVVFGHDAQQAAINAILELADEGGKDQWQWTPPAPPQALIDKISEMAANDINEAFRIKSKSTRSAKLDEIKRAIDNGVDEIDVVWNVTAFKTGIPWTKIELAKCSKLAHDHQKIIKVIIETAYLSDQEIVEACKLCADAGVDFVKTSTGFAPAGAKSEHIALIKGSWTADEPVLVRVHSECLTGDV